MSQQVVGYIRLEFRRKVRVVGNRSYEFVWVRQFKDREKKRRELGEKIRNINI